MGPGADDRRHPGVAGDDAELAERNGHRIFDLERSLHLDVERGVQRALDHDTSMPGANALGIADYEAALAQYDRANRALDLADDNPRLRVAEARAAIKEGNRRISDAKVRLGVTPIP